MLSEPRPTLRQWLASEGGAVPFRRFMEAALYDPKFGYYSSRIRSVGARGDFSTSATLSPLLARAIAAWIVRHAPGDCRHIVEIGPGSGSLHRALREALGWRGRWRWRSHLVERSPVLRAEQQRTLGWLGRGVSWHETPAAALRAAEGCAMIFSNELVDAFPVTLLERHEGIWQEVWLELTPERRLVETLRPITGHQTALIPDAFPTGQRIECHTSYQEWCGAWRSAWQRGSMLTIDYGDTADRLYHRRPRGTLRGYYQHRCLVGLDLYRDPGHCDLTADVNFTDLMQWGAGAGWGTVSLTTQSEFVAEYASIQSTTDARLSDPLGAGGAFKCLIQQPLRKPQISGGKRSGVP